MPILRRINNHYNSVDSIENYVGGLISTGVFNPEKLIELLKSKGFEHNHNALFDFEVPMLCLLVSSKQGDLIMDVYSGLATTGLVSYGMKRKYLGIEFSEDYATQSKARFDAMFGIGEMKKRSSASKKKSTSTRKNPPLQTTRSRSKTK